MAIYKKSSVIPKGLMPTGQRAGGRESCCVYDHWLYRLKHNFHFYFFFMEEGVFIFRLKSERGREDKAQLLEGGMCHKD